MSLEALLVEDTGAPRPVVVKPYTYPYIPFLQQLLKTEGGRPGVTYFQVAHEHQQEVQAQGFTRIADAKEYTIEGPKGSVYCILMGYGRPIQGADAKSSLRRCYVDSMLEWSTGLTLRDEVLLERVHIERPPALPEPTALSRPNGTRPTPTPTSESNS